LIRLLLLAILTISYVSLDAKSIKQSRQSVIVAEEGQPPANTKLAPYDPYFPEDAAVNDTNFMGEFLYMLFIVSIMAAILIGATWFLKKMQTQRVFSANSSSLIKVIDQRLLAQGAAVYLIQVGNQSFLVANTQSGVAQIGEIKMPIQDPQEMVSSFEKMLKNKENPHEKR